VAFKIIQKIKPKEVKSRDLDMSFIKKYLKQVQTKLIKNTKPEVTTDYYFCRNYDGDQDLLVIGKHAPAYKKIFKETAKGKHGFDKADISIGKCFALEENGKYVLCIYHNKSASKGKKGQILRALKKLQRKALKKFSEIRWLDKPMMSSATDEDDAEQVDDQQDTATGTADATQESEPLVSGEEVVTRMKQLKQGIDKLKKDVMQRFKKRETTPKDAAFVKALRKAGNIVLTKLMQTDEKTANKLADQQKQLEKALPQWKDLEGKIENQKSKEEIVDELKGVVKELNEKRTKIKEILKRVNLKKLA